MKGVGSECLIQCLQSCRRHPICPDAPKTHTNNKNLCPRQPAEVARGTVEGAINAPLSTLRGANLEALPDDKRLYVFCQVAGGG